MTPTTDEIIAATERWLGTPYRHQAATLGAGCDCLGLIRGVWRSLYGDEPWTVPPYGRAGSDAQLAEAAARYLIAADDVAAGRVLLFRLRHDQPPRHCGIAISQTRFIHAQEQIGVVAADLTESWQRRLWAVFSFPDRT